ncbi:hypothetical protein ECEC4402_5960, partial [Escherichia coli EC4402]
MIEMPDFLAGKRRRREAGFIALPFFISDSDAV